MRQIIFQNAIAILLPSATSLLQNASGFFIAKCNSYYKMQRFYYKMRRLLQIAPVYTRSSFFDPVVLETMSFQTAVSSMAAISELWRKLFLNSTHVHYRGNDSINWFFFWENPCLRMNFFTPALTGNNRISISRVVVFRQICFLLSTSHCYSDWGEDWGCNYRIFA